MSCRGSRTCTRQISAIDPRMCRPALRKDFRSVTPKSGNRQMVFGVFGNEVDEASHRITHRLTGQGDHLRARRTVMGLDRRGPGVRLPSPRRMAALRGARSAGGRREPTTSSRPPMGERRSAGRASNPPWPFLDPAPTRRAKARGTERRSPPLPPSLWVDCRTPPISSVRCSLRGSGAEHFVEGSNGLGLHRGKHVRIG